MKARVWVRGQHVLASNVLLPVLKMSRKIFTKEKLASSDQRYFLGIIDFGFSSCYP
jgi:hypothetical protein